MSALNQLLRRMVAELAENGRLRLMIWMVFAIVWIYALLVAADHEAQLESQIKVLQSKLAQSRGIGVESQWHQRTVETEQLLEAMRALTWPGGEPDLANAEVQDWLRRLAGKTGLPVQDLRVIQAESPAAASAPTGRRQVLHYRLSVEFSLLPIGAFLQELGQAERGVVVERLQFKTWTRPATADLDLRVRLRGAEDST